MKLGAERFIVQEDLDDLAVEDASGNLGNRLQANWNEEGTKKS